MWKVWCLFIIIFALASFYYKSSLLFSSLVGSLFSLIISFFVDNLLTETILFLTLSLISYLALFLTLLRVKKYHLNRYRPTTDSLIGHQGIVTQSIGNNYLESGFVKLDGEYWPAISYNNRPISKGHLVQIRDINGIRLVVAPTK